MKLDIQFRSASLVTDVIQGTILLCVIGAATGFALGLQWSAFFCLAVLTGLAAHWYPKQLFIYIVITFPISLEVVHASRDLLTSVTSGMNANGLHAVLLTGIALPVIIVKAWRAGWRPALSILVLTAYLTLCAVTVFYSAEKTSGIIYLIWMAYPLIAYILYQYLRIKGRFDRDKLVNYILIATMVSAVIGYLLFLNGIQFYGSKYPVVWDTGDIRYSNPLYIGHGPQGYMMAICSLLALYMFVSKKNLLYLIYLIPAAFFLTITYTRMPFVYWFFFLAAFAIIAKKYKILIVVVAISIGIVFFTPMNSRFGILTNVVRDFFRAQQYAVKIESNTPKVANETVPQVAQDREESKEPVQASPSQQETEEIQQPIDKDANKSWKKVQSSMSGRELLMTASIEIIKESPLLGHGLGTTPPLLKNILHEEWKITSAQTNTTHSEVLRSWAESGIVALLLLLAFIIRLYVEAIKRVGQEREAGYVMLLIVTFLTVSMFIDPFFTFYRGLSTLTFLCLASLAVGRTADKSPVV